MTSLGGVGHTLPFLVHNFRAAMGAAVAVVVVELAAISCRGALVFQTGVLIGSS